MRGGVFGVTSRSRSIKEVRQSLQREVAEARKVFAYLCASASLRCSQSDERKGRNLDLAVDSEVGWKVVCVQRVAGEVVRT